MRKECSLLYMYYTLWREFVKYICYIVWMEFVRYTCYTVWIEFVRYKEYRVRVDCSHRITFQYIYPWIRVRMRISAHSINGPAAHDENEVVAHRWNERLFRQIAHQLYKRFRWPLHTQSQFQWIHDRCQYDNYYLYNIVEFVNII